LLGCMHDRMGDIFISNCGRHKRIASRKIGSSNFLILLANPSLGSNVSSDEEFVLSARELAAR
jgi:hypothetical protein